MKTFRLFLTGGTVDKSYDQYKGVLSYKASIISKLLIQSRCVIPYVIEELMLKDSLELNFSDRVLIREACKRVNEDIIIITHGTDTMVETANALSSIKNKTIILTGSIIPAVIENSDAMFNIGTAIAYSQSLPYGVYIAMNGIAFPHSDVKKNINLQAFENLY